MSRSITTTLPDGTWAVVHSDSLIWDKTTLWTKGGLGVLGATVIEKLRRSGTCLAVQHEDLGVIATPCRSGAMEITARVLCTDAVCRTAAVQGEQDLYQEHPDTPAARATRRAAAGFCENAPSAHG